MTPRLLEPTAKVKSMFLSGMQMQMSTVKQLLRNMSVCCHPFSFEDPLGIRSIRNIDYRIRIFINPHAVDCAEVAVK